MVAICWVCYIEGTMTNIYLSVNLTTTVQLSLIILFHGYKHWNKRDAIEVFPGHLTSKLLQWDPDTKYPDVEV